MSRSGYTDDNEDPLALGRWRQAVKMALGGKRGQALLKELIESLDSMEDKRLYPGSFATADGEFCALGIIGHKRGTKMDDLGNEDDCDYKLVGQRFNIAPAMAAEIMYLNDEYIADTFHWIDVEICGPMQPYHVWPHGPKTHKRSVNVLNEKHATDRFTNMRKWAIENLKTV